MIFSALLASGDYAAFEVLSTLLKLVAWASTLYIQVYAANHGVPHRQGKNFSLFVLWILLLAGYTMKLHSLHLLSIDGGQGFYFFAWTIGYAAIWILTISAFIIPISVQEPLDGFPEEREERRVSHESRREDEEGQEAGMLGARSDDGSKDEFSKDFVPEEDEGEVFPESQASCLSNLFYCWVWKILQEGYRAPLKRSSIFRIPDDMRGPVLRDQFETLWSEAKEKAKTKDPPELPGLFSVLAYQFRCQLAFVFLLCCSAFTIQYVAPLEVQSQLIQVIIKDYMHGEYGNQPVPCYAIGKDGGVNNTAMCTMADGPFPDEDDASGYLWAMLLGVMLFTQAMIQGQIEKNINKVSVCVHNILTGQIYQKTCRLSSQGLEDHEIGEINGLMVGDVEQVANFVRIFNFLAMIPISLTILLSYIFEYFKPGAVFAGIGCAMVGPLPVVVIVRAS